MTKRHLNNVHLETVDMTFPESKAQEIALKIYMNQTTYRSFDEVLKGVRAALTFHNSRAEAVIQIPDEMYNFIKVVEFGVAKGYEPNNWLEPNGKRCSEKAMHDSMFHHLAESFSKDVKIDKESGLDPLLHLACRALMLYTRRQKGIVHGDDI